MEDFDIYKSLWEAVKVIGIGFVILLILNITLGPLYRIWTAEQSGRAQLAEAEYAKQVAVQEARAKLQD